ncbi:HAD-IC family P-type ATPase [Methylocystis hirsuta]|uniref:HAD family hydrolase n=1 Tax=Methylocystis hirsuta TaxID=369798 RepID=A0A3M9XMU1_9HYPH|nr:HAD-IC family P-type ATPase [Methylocystis hirsuta]RNJ48190.1 HAD family hydrolase [Methylocystis hirsuta]
MAGNALRKKDAWWSVPPPSLLAEFGSNERDGLSADGVSKSRERFGANTIDEVKPTSAFKLVLDGIREPMMLVLLAIAVLSFVFGKTNEAIVMVFVVAAYIAVEFVNKYRTDRTMAALRQLTSPTTKAIRDGQAQEIPTTDVVVGDVLVLTEGVRVPADGRLLEAYGLVVNEAALTGESLPVEKDAKTIVSADAPLAERKNSVFSGTVVMSGEGKALACAVGRESEFGETAHEVAVAAKEKTLLQETMTRLAKVLAIFALAVSALIPAVGFLRGLNLQEMIVTWLALTFLMIPGQPPIIITMALALASFRLANIKLVVKRLRGVEVLAQITAVVTDKTGTITENRMRVETFILLNGEERTPASLSADNKRAILLALPMYSNDPTDLAVRSVVQDSIDVPRQASFSGFGEDRPLRIIGYDIGGKRLGYAAGKAERLIESVSDSSRKERLRRALEVKVGEGKRVVAYGQLQNSDDPNKAELLALAVLSDPVRQGVAQTITELEAAKVETIMVTGDHPATAATIAREIGLDAEVLTGGNLENMSESELESALEKTKAFARISPAQKLRLVQALRQEGQIVAVIGDGINDAPALKAADVGIAMGEIGADLAKETADLVLTDDNYTHVADAIGVARSALDNFRKGLTYYLTAKGILLAIFLVPLALGVPFPFAPIHIILTELLMDLASSTIFVTEAAEPDVMKKRAPRLDEFLGRELVFEIIRNGAALAVGITALYLSIYFQTGDLVLAQTAAFVTWLLGHIALALNLKQEKLSLFKQGLFSNRFGASWLVGMIIFSVAITSTPTLNIYFKTAALGPDLWIAIIAVTILTTFWIEVAKVVKGEQSASDQPYSSVRGRKGVAWAVLAALLTISFGVILIGYGPKFFGSQETEPSSIEKPTPAPTQQVTPAPPPATLTVRKGVGSTIEKQTQTETGEREAKTVGEGPHAYARISLPNGVELDVSSAGVERKLLAFLESTPKSAAKIVWFDFDRVSFGKGKKAPQMSSREQLQNIARILSAYAEVKVVIGGHTDSLGNAIANKRLSKARADIVTRELTQMGVAPSRLEAKGYGEDRPIAGNDTEEGRAKNRRISLGVIRE